jgi:chromosome segregation ATPase
MTDKKTKVNIDPDFNSSGFKKTDIAERFAVGPNPREIRESEIEQRQREIDHLRDTIKAMQQQIDDQHNEIHRLDLLANEKETARKATKEDFDRLKIKTDELEEAMRKSIKEQGFTQASQLQRLPEASQIWLPAEDAIILFAALRNSRDKAVAKWQHKRKILLQWEAASGRVKGAELEPEEAYTERLRISNATYRKDV